MILVARNETKALQTSIQLHDSDIATKIYLADVSRPREVRKAHAFQPTSITRACCEP